MRGFLLAAERGLVSQEEFWDLMLMCSFTHDDSYALILSISRGEYTKLQKFQITLT